MGLFDTVRSSYPLISDKADRELQTKDLDSLMAWWWISPAGELFRVQRSAVMMVPPGRKRGKWLPWRMVENVASDVRARLVHDKRTALVVMYPAVFTGNWESRQQVQVLFEDGVIQWAKPYRGLIGQGDDH